VRARALRLTFALVACVLLACSDSTAPTEGAFQVIVNPDTVSRTGQTAGTARVTLRNTSRAAVAIDQCNVRLEREVSPGVWPAPSPPTVACIAEQLAAQSERTEFRSVGTLPGRYRFAYGYWFAGTSAGQDSSRLTAYSNIFFGAP
jgi:hypothetical protein